MKSKIRVVSSLLATFVLMKAALGSSDYVQHAFNEPICSRVSVVIDAIHGSRQVKLASANQPEADDPCTDFGDRCVGNNCCCHIITGATGGPLTFTKTDLESMTMYSKNNDQLHCYLKEPRRALVPSKTLITRVFQAMSPHCEVGAQAPRLKASGASSSSPSTTATP